MTTAANYTDIIGFQGISNSGSSIEIADSNTSYRPLMAPGTIIPFIDPYYGSGSLIRLVVPANTTAIKVGTLSTWAAASNAGFTSNFSYVIAPVTANLNRPFAVSLNAVPLNASVPQYAWFLIQGTFPVWALAATAINTPLYISATAGAAFVTLTAGRQLVGVNPVVASTGTVVKAASTVNGSAIITVQNSDGWFVGQNVSGTGIATSLIAAIDQTGTKVTLASVATATGATTATATNNDATNFFPICQFSSPFFQGNIT